MEILLKFITEHAEEDVSRLILQRDRYPDINMDLVVNCIESRRKLKGKVQEWYDEPRLIFPFKLSAEQCSSSSTGRYKAELASRIVSGTWTLVDLTGGLGVDSWLFSRKAAKVIYNEMRPELCNAARHNFKVLGVNNIDVVNSTITSRESLDSLLSAYPAADIMYIDPARRGEGGRKVFLIEECTPDVLLLKDEIFKHTRHLLIKLSPMADITMVCERLGSNCREVHVVATGGECKELLVWLDREWTDDYTVIAVELNSDSTAATFAFTPTSEKEASASVTQSVSAGYLFEPGKSLMKAGAFNLIGTRLELDKLGRSTHYYTTASTKTAASLKGIGKVYEILESHPLDKRSIKEIGKRYPRAEVTARNIPMDTDTLKKKLGINSGDDAHIFGLKSDLEGNLLIVARRVY